MQLFTRIKTDRHLELPINYNHILQAIVYRAIERCDPGFSEHMHDEGSRQGPRVYKPFTFGRLEGKYVIKNKRITFTEDIFWEIRSFDADVIVMLDQFFSENGIVFSLGSNIKKCSIATQTTDYHIESKDVIIEARTPITAYLTQNAEGNYTEYFTPEELGFYELTKQNSIRKYESITGMEYTGVIDFEPMSIKASDKEITTYKGTIIEGWKGKYILRGDPSMIDFLFQTGIGSKNSQGFGMFDIVDES